MRILNTLALGLLLVSTIACGGASSSPTSGLPGGTDGPDVPTLPPTTGRMLRVSVTDAPFPINYVKEASVEITEVQVRNQEGEGWETLPLPADGLMINLVPLTGGVMEEIANFAIEPGTYDEVRLLVGPGQVVLKPEAFVADADREIEDGCYLFSVEDGGLKFPSGTQTGLKVKIDPPIVVTDQLSGDLVLDFDLAKNFVFNGPVTHSPGVKRVLFTPSMKAINSTVNGSVFFTVLSNEDASAIVGAEVNLFVSDTDVRTDFTGDDGKVSFPGVPAGTYKATADAYGFEEGTIDPVDVILANLVDGGTFTLAVATDEIVGVVSIDTDAEDDPMLEGVKVEATVAGESLVRVMTTTNESGAYTLSPLDPSYFYDVTFSKTGYVSFTELGTYPRVAGTDAPLNVQLAPASVDVTVTVTDDADVVQGDVVVTITDGDGAQVGNTSDSTTDSTLGTFVVTLTTGSYTFAWTDAVHGAQTQSEDVIGGAVSPTTAITLKAVAPPATTTTE